MDVIMENNMKYYRFFSFLFLMMFFGFTAPSWSNSKHPATQLYVHTQKEFFMPGEILWFKIFAFNNEHKPVNNDEVKYVEILSEKGESIWRTKLSKDIGSVFDAGSWFVPANLNTGNYYLISYTNNLKLKGENSFFKKRIQIYSPYDTTSNKTENVQLTPQLKVDGGSLLQGQKANIAYNIPFASLSEENYVLELYNSDNPDQIELKVPISSVGIGQFEFTPLGNSYSARIISHSGESIPVVFPKIASTGVGLNFRHNQYNEATYDLVFHGLNGSFFINILHKGKNLLSVEKQIELPQTVFTGLTFETEDSGLFWLQVLDSKGKVFAEKAFLNILKDGVQSLDLQTDQEIYAPKSSMKLDLNSPNETELLLSVSKDYETIPQANEVTLFNSLWFDQEVRELGYVRNKMFLQSLFDRNHTILDPFLIFLERKSNSSVVVDNLPSKSNKITFKYTRPDGLPISNEWARLQVQGPIDKYYLTKTDSEGIAVFKTDPIIGNRFLYTQLEIPRNMNVQIEDEFYQFVDFSSFISSIKPQLIDKQVDAISLNNYFRDVQIQNAYFKKERALFKEVNEPLSQVSFWGNPDKEYNLDDYIRFVLMEEVLKEYIPEINVRKRGENYDLRVYCPKRSLFYENEPLLLFDGVPIENAKVLVEFNPLKIEKISLSTSAFILGSRKYEGVISFKSYTGNQVSELEEAFQSAKLSYVGYHQPREFFVPNHASKDPKIENAADYRNQVYWTPLKSSLNSQVEYFNPELSGNYSIWIEGIDQNGVLYWGKRNYQILP